VALLGEPEQPQAAEALGHLDVPVTEEFAAGPQALEQLRFGFLEPADVAVGVADDRAH
jgi:hypothetical protein